MFSLIITVIAIALVAVLALATLYYGGAAFGKGAARAEASKLLLQGQQLLGAADLYFTEKREWPATIDQLVSGGYLKQIPSAQASGLNEALAAGTQWQMVSGQPTFYTSTQATDVCAEVNLSASLKKRGVLKRAYTNLVAQCYGDASLTTVFRKDTTSSFPAGTDVGGSDAPSDPADPDWNVPPGGSTNGPGPGPVVSYPPMPSAYCAAYFPTMTAGDPNGPWGSGAVFQVSGAGAGPFATYPAIPSASSGGQPLTVTGNGSFGSGTAAVYVDTSSLAVGTRTVTLRASNNDTVDCSIDIVAADQSSGQDVAVIFLDPVSGPSTGGTTVTLSADSGEFRLNGGRKPVVQVWREDLQWGGTAQFYQLADSDVTYVDSTHLKVKMVPADYVGSTKQQPDVFVSVANYGSSNTASSDNSFKYVWPAPPVGTTILAWTPASPDLGQVDLGDSASGSAKLKNTGTGAVTYKLQWGEGVGGNGWNVQSGSCVRDSNTTLLPGEFCTVFFTFTASSEGPSSVTIPVKNISTGSQVDLTVRATGFDPDAGGSGPGGVPALYGNAANLGSALIAGWVNPDLPTTSDATWEQYSAAYPRSFPEQDVFIYNKGSAPGGVASVYVSGSTFFQVVSQDCVGNAIDPNDVQHCTVHVKFKPTRYTPAGLNQGTLKVVGSNGDVSDVPLSATLTVHDVFTSGVIRSTAPGPKPDFVEVREKYAPPFKYIGSDYACPSVTANYGDAGWTAQMDAHNTCVTNYIANRFAASCQYTSLGRPPFMVNDGPTDYHSVIECDRTTETPR